MAHSDGETTHAVFDQTLLQPLEARQHQSCQACDCVRVRCNHLLIGIAFASQSFRKQGFAQTRHCAPRNEQLLLSQHGGEQEKRASDCAKQQTHNPEWPSPR